MLKHGSEGVRQIEAQVTNTLGWSATTGQVEPWVYRELTETYVLDPEMRERLARLNPKASAEAGQPADRGDGAQLLDSPTRTCSNALRHAGEDLEDRLEGSGSRVAA